MRPGVTAEQGSGTLRHRIDSTPAETGDGFPNNILPETDSWETTPDGDWRGPPGPLCRIAPVAASPIDDESGGDVPANEVVWADPSIIALAEHGRR